MFIIDRIMYQLWTYYGKTQIVTTIGNHGRNYGQIMDFMDIMDDLWLGYVCIMCFFGDLFIIIP
jgi:hypothetical protein